MVPEGQSMAAWRRRQAVRSRALRPVLYAMAAVGTLALVLMSPAAVSAPNPGTPDPDPPAAAAAPLAAMLRGDDNAAFADGAGREALAACGAERRGVVRRHRRRVVRGAAARALPRRNGRLALRKGVPPARVRRETPSPAPSTCRPRRTRAERSRVWARPAVRAGLRLRVPEPGQRRAEGVAQEGPRRKAGETPELLPRGSRSARPSTLCWAA